MSNKRNCKKNKNKKTVYALTGVYDLVGGYHEIGADVNFNEIPKYISKNICLNEDITIHIAPKIEVRVFAKSKKIIDEFLNVEKNPNFIKEIFDCFSKHNGPSKEYIWTTFDLEERRKIREEVIEEYELAI